MSDTNFVDYVKIFCRSGKGGSGSAHLRREKFNPKGGPDGGDGGRGGNIILRGNSQLWTLLHLKFSKHIFAGHGEPGSSNNKTGADGKDVIIEVRQGRGRKRNPVRNHTS
jgi:GTP-binding protein